jgi:hypothetical protein
MKMSNQPARSLRRYWWRLVLLLLVVVAILPEVAIYLVATYAKIEGCTQDAPCMIGNITASSVVTVLLRSGVRIANSNIPAVWIVLSYLMVIFGWQRLISRLFLGLAVTIVFGALYLPETVIAPLVNTQCKTSSCIGDIGDVPYGMAQMDLLTVLAIMFFAFLAYVLVSIVFQLHLVWRRKRSSQ